MLIYPCAIASDIIVMTGEWKPYVSNELPHNGFFAEIVSQVFKTSGLEATFHFAPWPRCEANIKHGKAFAAFPYTINKTRKVFAWFSEPIALSRSVFFYNREKLSDFDYTNMEDLKPYLIGGIRGYFYEETFSKAQLSIDYSENESDAFKKLFFGKVDIVPVNELVGWGIIKQLYKNQTDLFSTSKSAMSDTELTLMVSKTFPGARDLMQTFNKGLQIIKNNGTYNEILIEHQVPLTVGVKNQENPTGKSE